MMEAPSRPKTHVAVIPRLLWIGEILQALERESEQTLLANVRRCRGHRGETRWLCRNLAEPSLLATPSDTTQIMAIRNHDGSGTVPYAESDLGRYPSSVVAILNLGIGPMEGCAWGFVRDREFGYLPIDRLDLPGTGMISLPLSWPGPKESNSDRDDSDQKDEALYRRTASALGEEGLRRLQDVRPLIVGCGSTGSQMASYTVAMGMRQPVLVDHDDFEPHNVPGGLVKQEWLESRNPGSRNKANLLAEFFADFVPKSGGPMAIPVAISKEINSPEAIRAAREANLIVSCVDNDGARLFAASLAAAYLLPHLDLSTGIVLSETFWGFDVRLILPGDGCLVCRGGLRDPAEARRQLLAASPTVTRDERAGQLRSLNSAACAEGQELLERLACETLTRSTWVRRIGSEREVIDEFPNQPECEVCANAGVGDTLFGISEEFNA